MPFLTRNQKTTQDHLDIEDIRDDLVVCKNGQISLILETSAVNFDLLSEKEQEAKILAFGNLLNSLNFYIQILVRTERTDLSKYLDMLYSYRNKVDNPNLERQIDIYINFIKNLITNNEVLDKRFFIVISSSSGVVIKTNPFKQLFGKPEKITNINPLLERAKRSLYPRRDHLMKQLQAMTIFGRQLTTDELVKLFYSTYNPDTPGLQKLQIKYLDVENQVVTGSITKDLLN